MFVCPIEYTVTFFCQSYTSNFDSKQINIFNDKQCCIEINKELEPGLICDNYNIPEERKLTVAVHS